MGTPPYGAAVKGTERFGILPGADTALHGSDFPPAQFPGVFEVVVWGLSPRAS